MQWTSSDVDSSKLRFRPSLINMIRGKLAQLTINSLPKCSLSWEPEQTPTTILSSLSYNNVQNKFLTRSDSAFFKEERTLRNLCNSLLSALKKQTKNNKASLIATNSHGALKKMVMISQRPNLISSSDTLTEMEITRWITRGSWV